MVADCLQGHLGSGFNDHFIMDVHHDRTASERVHGIAENIAGGCLDDILYELGAIAVEPFPFLRTADTFVGDAVPAELVGADFRFYIGKLSAGRSVMNSIPLLQENVMPWVSFVRLKRTASMTA